MTRARGRVDQPAGGGQHLDLRGAEGEIDQRMGGLRRIAQRPRRAGRSSSRSPAPLDIAREGISPAAPMKAPLSASDTAILALAILGHLAGDEGLGLRLAIGIAACAPASRQRAGSRELDQIGLVVFMRRAQHQPFGDENGAVDQEPTVSSSMSSFSRTMVFFLSRQNEKTGEMAAHLP